MSARLHEAPVAIIGGGFSGAAVAWHLLAIRPDIERLVIVEPRAELGRGLAYSASDPCHRTNVPSTRMSLVPDQPNHFIDWLERTGCLAGDPSAFMPDGRIFPARAVFGDYVRDTLATLGPRLVHVQAQAEAIEASRQGYDIACSDGSFIHAERVVLAVAHGAPCPPSLLDRAFTGQPRYIRDPWNVETLAAIRPHDRVLIVGTGLTMADIVASLDRLGHRGEIVAVSRRGLRSRGHPAVQHDPYGDFATTPARTASALVRRIRETLAAAASEGKTWQCVFDQIRLQGRAIWAALPLKERTRLLRHLRPFWDVHRFRIAPQIEQGLERRLADGRLHMRAASLSDARAEGETLRVALRSRRCGEACWEDFDAVVVATGPAHGRVFLDNPVLATLEAAGLARADALRLGIDVTLDGHAIGTDGFPRTDLFVAGPLARGTIGELMGLPDVTNYAVHIAHEVDRSLVPASTTPARAVAR